MSGFNSNITSDIAYKIDEVKELLNICDEDKERKNEKILNSYNRIIFGAPGTGKSFKIDEDIKKNKLNKLFTRITFHPNYTYAQFVGSYKPISKLNDMNKKEVLYEFVPGPFLKVLVDSLNDEKKGIPHLLVIEEINRGNSAAIFGDIFQLLDRDNEGKSCYKINLSKEMKDFFQSEEGLGERFDEILGKDSQEIYIPNNMYIWATMNSADQGVYPMDSAFKRRWSFEYIGIDKNEEKLKGINISLRDKNNSYSVYEWNKVRKTINKKLKESGKINEDKLLGPFFLSKIELLKCKENQEEFDEIFKSKVLMYLYEDILKHKKIDFFVEGIQTLSDVMNAYDDGKVFDFEIEKIQIEDYDCNLKIADEQNQYKIKE